MEGGEYHLLLFLPANQSDEERVGESLLGLSTHPLKILLTLKIGAFQSKTGEASNNHEVQ